MTVGQFLILGALAFGLFAVVVLAVARSIKPVQPTVENERDYPDDEHDAPCWALIERVHDANVSGL